MKAKLVLLLAAMVACAFALPRANAHEEIFTAILNGPNESPPNGLSGTGFVTVTLDLDLFTLRVEANFSDLFGTTTAAHIHAPRLFLLLDSLMSRPRRRASKVFLLE